jgi:hypothetical protein
VARGINSGLGEIVSVTNLVVRITGIAAQFHESADLLASDDEFDIDFDPAPDWGSEVSFDVVIPKRLHRELTLGVADTLSSESLEFNP